MNYDLKENESFEVKIKSLEFKVARLQSKSDETITVNTNNGKIRGAKRWTLYGDSYYSFEHVPYAIPPLGERRFRAPKPIGSWKQVKDCTYYGEKPRQMYFDNVIAGTEDCLYLNIYTNKISPTKSRPVMVWLYGGGFLFGEANPEWYGPDHFMKKDVVLVTVQYRVGALGFLSLKDPHLNISGNGGLKDQILALKWIKKNCSVFGGNSDCITVFGESAGAASTMLLALSPQTKNLFHRAIAQSGVATADWAITDSPKYSFALAQKAGYTGENNEKKVLKYLLDCTSDDIILAERELSIELQGGGILFGPCIEPYVTQYTVIECHPMEMIKNSWGNDIPLMLGGTSKEGLFMKPLLTKFPGIVDFEMESCIRYLPKLSIVDPNSQESKDKGMKLRSIHVKNDKATNDDFYELLSYYYFWNPMWHTITTRVKSANKNAPPTYLYRFDFDSNKMEHPFRLQRLGRDEPGVAHTDELAYLFSNILTKRMEPNSREYRTMRRMIDLWTAFAETGNPNSAKLYEMKNMKWHRIGQNDDVWKCLNIGDQLEYIDLPEMAKMKVWSQLYDLPKHTEFIDLSVYSKSSL